MFLVILCINSICKKYFSLVFGKSCKKNASTTKLSNLYFDVKTWYTFKLIKLSFIIWFLLLVSTRDDQIL